MPVGEVCIREVIICNRKTTITEAAQLMRRYHVGDLLVVDESDDKRTPVGIVTDRDIVLNVVAMKLDPSVVCAGDILGERILTVREDEGIFETMQRMRAGGIRRMPVIDDRGRLVGIVAIDDLIQLLAEEMNELAKLISKEQAQEVQRKPLPIVP